MVPQRAAHLSTNWTIHFQFREHIPACCVANAVQEGGSSCRQSSPSYPTVSLHPQRTKAVVAFRAASFGGPPRPPAVHGTMCLYMFEPVLVKHKFV
eukprot:CAMPEP_0174380330 /NCGR_PEP_ID=MMETSP0811_2-20130205/123300_1 /TAXON_ID=73025 ORGANISM="Eutreptiella gymnastica-like, Strain CCMP1594" /NCGR_SAMPLE_ID=MMETSP0811_2 /ASSEMBLY_ACC=CAM_ASM_000667 /LENGTH=95 /DNA_ID=CAMNT_0015533161 /DNA_START=459 /DNA_END=746 /DNA_ORIENTATION=-